MAGGSLGSRGRRAGKTPSIGEFSQNRRLYRTFGRAEQARLLGRQAVRTPGERGAGGGGGWFGLKRAHDGDLLGAGARQRRERRSPYLTYSEPRGDARGNSVTVWEAACGQRSEKVRRCESANATAVACLLSLALMVRRFSQITRILAAFGRRAREQTGASRWGHGLTPSFVR